MTNNQQQAIEESLIASVELEALREQIAEQRIIINQAEGKLWEFNVRMGKLNRLINTNLSLVLVRKYESTYPGRSSRSGYRRFSDYNERKRWI